MCGRCVVCVVCVVASTSVAPSTSVTAAASTTPARGPARQANVQATSNLPASLATLHTCCTNPAMLVRTCINACMLKHGCFFSKAEQSLPLTRISQPQIRPFLPGDSPFPTVSSKSLIAYSGMSQECVIVCTLVTACVIGFAICTRMCVWLTLAFLQQAVCFTKLLACSCRKEDIVNVCMIL